MTLYLADAFGSMLYHETWKILNEGMGCAGALAMVNMTCGHSLTPHWWTLAGDSVRVHKGCKQGPPRGPPVWKCWMRTWPRYLGSGSGCGEIYTCPRLLVVMDNTGQGRGPTRLRGAIAWRTRLTYSWWPRAPWRANTCIANWRESLCSQCPRIEPEKLQL